MTNLFLVRHGQTDYNLEGKYQGHSDIPLNATGMQQAAAAVESIDGVTFAAIFASDLQRAVQTAEYFSRKSSVPIQHDPRLREINLGEWEGKHVSKIQEQYPILVAQRSEKPYSYAPPGGETVKDLAIRLIQVVDEICTKHPQGNVLIVAHGLSMATLYCLSKQIDLNDVFKSLFKNAEVREIQWTPGMITMEKTIH